MPWGRSVPWGKLQLMRILNLDKGFNMMDREGTVILNYHMPKAELSSFRKYKNGKFLYISNRKEDLKTKRFDEVYRAYMISKKPDRKLSVAGTDFCYAITSDRIDYHSASGYFPEFSLYKYLPVPCQNSVR